MTPYRYPNITGSTDAEQLRQLKGYLYQLVQQLNNTPTQAVATATAAVKAAAKIIAGAKMNT